MPITAKEMLEVYIEEMGLLLNEDIEAMSTNPQLVQDPNFPGFFLEENSGVEDIYEYEKILEEKDANNNPTITVSTPTGVTNPVTTGQSTGY